VWYSIPTDADIGVDIRVVDCSRWRRRRSIQGRLVAAHGSLRRRSGAGGEGDGLTQVALAVLGLMLAGVGDHPDAIWVVGALALSIAFASASQDIAYDAYTVDVLRPEEQGAAIGARTAMYRAAMAVAGGAAITAAGQYGWGVVNALLALRFLHSRVFT
jgi:PAT family beta-lactamase induction signal transducer AmpG